MLDGGVKICCGPRCGVEPNHRTIYEAVESAATLVAPTMCRGWCGRGVTIVLPGGDKIKARDAAEARAKLTTTLGG
jgi:hypothetical protein